MRPVFVFLGLVWIGQIGGSIQHAAYRRTGALRQVAVWRPPRTLRMFRSIADIADRRPKNVKNLCTILVRVLSSSYPSTCTVRRSTRVLPAVYR